jgi:Zn-dependent protease
MRAFENAPPPLPPPSPWQRLKKWLGPLGLALVLLFKFGAKLKFVLIPLLKWLPVALKTGGTMFLSIGIYAMQWGWWFALGFVLLLLVHECGHLFAARRVGLKVGAPVFIPFMGAFIALKEAPHNAWIEAQVAIGGPLVGAAGALACDGLFLLTGNPLFRALAFTGYMLNLFNLIPVGFLDGGRVVKALSPWLWVVGAVVMVALLVYRFNLLLLIVLALAVPQLIGLFRRRTPAEERWFEVTPGQRQFMALLYFGLMALLAFGLHMTQL